MNFRGDLLWGAGNGPSFFNAASSAFARVKWVLIAEKSVLAATNISYQFKHFFDYYRPT